MSYMTVFNPGDTPVPVGGGRTAGGGEWAVAYSTDDEVQAALEAGRLVKVDVPSNGDDVNPDAEGALDRSVSTQQRYEELQGWDKGDLAEFAERQGLVDDPDMNVDPLRRAVAESTVEIPSDPGAASPAAETDQSQSQSHDDDAPDQ